MKEIRLEKTNNEGLATMVSGINSGATQFALSDEHDIKSLIKERDKEKYNQKVEEFESKFTEHQKSLEEAANEMANTIQDVAIKVIDKNILVEPFKTNPFQKMIQKNGIITDLGGATPIYKSNESGKLEEEEKYIFQGSVIEVGPKCEYVKPGDIIMWTKPSEVPIPFYKFGWVLINEMRVLCVINDRKELEARW